MVGTIMVDVVRLLSATSAVTKGKVVVATADGQVICFGSAKR